MGRTGNLRDYMADMARSNAEGGSGGGSSSDDTLYEVIECTIGTEQSPASTYIIAYSDDNFRISGLNFNSGYNITIQLESLDHRRILFVFRTTDSGTIITNVSDLNTDINITLFSIDTTNILFGGDPTILELDGWGDIIFIYNGYKVIIHCYIDVYRGSQE